MQILCDCHHLHYFKESMEIWRLQFPQRTKNPEVLMQKFCWYQTDLPISSYFTVYFIWFVQLLLCSNTAVFVYKSQRQCASPIWYGRLRTKASWSFCCTQTLNEFLLDARERIKPMYFETCSICQHPLYCLRVCHVLMCKLSLGCCLQLSEPVFLRGRPHLCCHMYWRTLNKIKQRADC